MAFGLLDEAEETRRRPTSEPDGAGKRLSPERQASFPHPFLCEVLAKEYGQYGHRLHMLLLQDTAPSWLYEVKQGATTVWETWTGIDTNGHPVNRTITLRRDRAAGCSEVCAASIWRADPDHRSTPNPAL